MDEDKVISLKDLLSGGKVLDKLLGILPDILSKQKQKKLLEQLAQGKPVIEFHTKAGRRNEPPNDFEVRDCIAGHMTLPTTGEWTCYAIWSGGGTPSQGLFRLKIDPQPRKNRVVAANFHTARHDSLDFHSHRPLFQNRHRRPPPRSHHCGRTGSDLPR